SPRMISANHPVPFVAGDRHTGDHRLLVGIWEASRIGRDHALSSTTRLEHPLKGFEGRRHGVADNAAVVDAGGLSDTGVSRLGNVSRQAMPASSRAFPCHWRHCG